MQLSHFLKKSSADLHNFAEIEIFEKKKKKSSQCQLCLDQEKIIKIFSQHFKESYYWDKLI